LRVSLLLIFDTNRDFEFTVPDYLLPESLRVGDVIKISKATPCRK